MCPHKIISMQSHVNVKLYRGHDLFFKKKKNGV